MNAVIETHNLTRRYGSTHALYPTTLAIPQGSIVALIGHNGAGKTTLIKMLMNLIRPSAGEATVLGERSTALGGRSFERIGYVSENQELPGWMTVGAFLRYLSGFYPHWDDAALIQRFQLPLRRKLKHLSRGQRMKVALASVLAFRPALLILDEPLSGLDPLVREDLLSALREAASESTIILSSHDLAEVESCATHVAFVHGGHLLFVEELPALLERFAPLNLRSIFLTIARAQDNAHPEAAR